MKIAKILLIINLLAVICLQTSAQGFSLKPLSSSTNIRFTSSFNDKDYAGLGVYFNKSYFNLGLELDFGYLPGARIEDDLLLPKDAERLHYLSDVIEIKGNEIKVIGTNYVVPQCQLAASPGINLKYISFECALGVFLGKEVELTATGRVSNKLHRNIFLARPTATIYIPLSSSEQGGLSVSLGYNFVPQTASLEGFIFSLGFFL